MVKLKFIVLVINLVFLLFYCNNAVIDKEKTLSNGKLLLFELAPVDPRSLMQGDYMRLNYALTTRLSVDSIPKHGFFVVTDSFGIAKNLQLQAEKTLIAKAKLPENQVLVKYKSTSQWQGINIGAESFFFQEGQAARYEGAKYGGLRIDAEGNSILIGLFDKNKVQLK